MGVEFIQLEASDLNNLNYRKAKPEEKAILLDLIALAMSDDIELPYNSIDNLIEYEELANLLNVKPTYLANAIRRFEKLIKLEFSENVVTLKLKFIEISKDKILEKSNKAKNAAKIRWEKEKQKEKNLKLQCQLDANVMLTHNECNANEYANAMPRREDKNREEERGEEKIISPPSFFKIQNTNSLLESQDLIPVPTEKGQFDFEVSGIEQIIKTESGKPVDNQENQSLVYDFYGEIERFYKEKNIFLQSKPKTLLLLNEALKKYKPDKLKIQLEKAIEKDNSKYLQPFGFLNFLERLHSFEAEKKTKNNQFRPPGSEPLYDDSGTLKPVLYAKNKELAHA